MMKLFLFASALCLAFGREVETYDGEFGHLFTAEEKAHISSQRVRREIRQLSTEEWQQIVDAMWVMKTTEQTEGESIYGDKFRNYDGLVCQHSKSGTRFGNIGHSNAAFPTFHRALHLEFEESMMAIDNRIESIPYWDFRLDIDDFENSVIFSDDYFGSISGNPDEDYVVTDGKFPYWAIPENRDNDTCAGGMVNNFGYLRSDYSVLYQPYTVRYGTHHCVYGPDYSLAYDNWFKCLESDYSGDIVNFLMCWDGSTHAYAHHFIGGTWLRDDQTIDSDQCTQWYSTINPGTDSCVTCPECVYGEDDWEDCFCQLISDDDDTSSDISTAVTAADTSPTTTEFDICDTITEADLEVAQLFGDFDDLAHSPNDPIFFFHHFNIDRYFFHFQLKYYDHEESYYEFPVDTAILGVNLDDVCGYRAPFMNIWDNDNVAYTNREILENTRFAVNTYHYDSIIDAIMGQSDTESDDGNTVITDDNDDDDTSVLAIIDSIDSASKKSFLNYSFNTPTFSLLLLVCAAGISFAFALYYSNCCGNRDFKDIDSITPVPTPLYNTF